MVDCILKNNLWMNRFYIHTLSRKQVEILTRLFKRGLKQLKDKLEIFVLDANCLRGKYDQYDQLLDFWGINKNGSDASAIDDDKEKLWFEELNVLKLLGFKSNHQFLDMKLLNGILAVAEHLNEKNKGNKFRIGMQISMNIFIENITNFESMDKLLSMIKKLMIARIPLMINITFERQYRQVTQISELYGPLGVNKFKDVYHKLFLLKFVFDNVGVQTKKLENKAKKEKKEKKENTKEQENDNSMGMSSWYEKPLWDDKDRFYKVRAKPIISLKMNGVDLTKVDLNKVQSLEKVELIVKTVDEN